MATISINADLLEKYELKFQPQNISNSLFPTQILGFGEISTVFSIEHPEFDGLIFKRMPMFETMSQSLAHEKLCHQYIDILENKIGINVQPITPEIARRYGLKETDGVLVVQVKPDSPASKAGIKRGDIIKEINHKKINNIADYNKAVAKSSIKEGVLLLIKREDQTFFVNIQIGD